MADQQQQQQSRAFCPISFEGPTVRLQSLLATFRRYCASDGRNLLCDDDVASDINDLVSNAPASVLSSATLDGCIALVPIARRNRNQLEPLFMCSQFLQPGTLERPANSDSVRFLFSGTTSGVFSPNIGRDCGTRDRACASMGTGQSLGLGFALPTGDAGRESGETLLLHGCLQAGPTRRCSFLDLGIVPGPSNLVTTIARIPQFAWCGTLENPQPALARAMALLATAAPVPSPNPSPPLSSPSPSPTRSPAPIVSSVGRPQPTSPTPSLTREPSGSPTSSATVQEQSGNTGVQVTAGILGLIAILSGATLAAIVLFLVRRRQQRRAKQEGQEVKSTYGSLSRRKSSAVSIDSFGDGGGTGTLGRDSRRGSSTPLASMHTVSTSDPRSPTKASTRYDPRGAVSPSLPTVGLTRLPLAALVSRPLDEILAAQAAADTDPGSTTADLVDAFDEIFIDLESHVMAQLVCSLPSASGGPTPSPASAASSTLPRPLSAMSVRTSNHQRAVRLAFATSALLSAVRGRPVSPGLVPEDLIPKFQALLQRMVRADPGSALVMIAAGQSALRYTSVTRVYHAAEGAMVTVTQGGEAKELVRHTAVVEATCFPGWVGGDGNIVVTARVSIS